MHRPKRISVINETGKKQSLPTGRQYFEVLPGKGTPIFLGLGPEPQNLSKLFPELSKANYIECPDFFRTSTVTPKMIPPEFTAINVEDLSQDAIEKSPLVIYKPAQRIFPAFWGPIISRTVLARQQLADAPKSKTIWITGDEKDLLAKEWVKAAELSGMQSRSVAPDLIRSNLLAFLKQEKPEIILSINFGGIDKYGENYYLLKASGVKVAVWIVDNPFHIISGLKSTCWQEIPLLVTDSWFIKPLMEHGAKKVVHMPLAADSELFSPDTRYSAPDNLRDIVFVGRSEFPDKNSFFAGCTMNSEEYDLAEKMIMKGQKPDFEFWTQKDQLSCFWPSSEVRRSGFKAEESGRLWRSTCLKSVQKKLTVFGDANWAKYLSQADIRGQVDYYSTLPAIYKNALINLNMTSPLLPSGLTQRNFDVWASGGFLLSDYGLGLDIFPTDLVDAISFKTPAQLPELADKFLSDPALRQEISKNWRETILAKHTYKNRLIQLLDFII